MGIKAFPTPTSHVPSNQGTPNPSTRCILLTTTSPICPIPPFETKMRLITSIILALLYAATIQAEDDPWRVNGQEPNTNQCYSSGIPPEKLIIGSEIFVDVSELCDYYGVLLEDSSEGGKNIGWLRAGHFVAFDVALSTGGYFDLEVRVASPDGDGAFEFRNKDTGTVYGVFLDIPATSGWQNWTTVSVGTVALDEGYSIIQLVSLESGWNLQWMKLTLLEGYGYVQEYEDYDIMVRAEEFTIPDGVVLDRANEVDQNLAFLFSGDTLQFDVPVSTAGAYQMWIRVANPLGIGSFLITNRDTSEIYADMPTIPSSTAWDDWIMVDLGTVGLTAGTVPLQFLVVEGAWNLMFVAFNAAEGSAPESQGTFFIVPATLFSSIQGAVVDGKLLGQLSRGDFAEYTVDVPVGGMYEIGVRVASPDGSGAFKLENAATGQLIGTASSLPASGSWFEGRSVNFAASLPAGSMRFKLTVEGENWNLLSLTFRL